jgi:hypothetical protein
MDIIEDRAFVGAQIDHAVADNHVGPAIFDRQVLRQPFPERDMIEA